MKNSAAFLPLFFAGVLLSPWIGCASNPETAPATAARPRIIVSTDIGGTDFDDYQSMVHLFVYADMFDIEGLVSSPYGVGRKKNILQVIDAYQKDYPNLKTHSPAYPTPDALRAISKQGSTESAGLHGYGKPSEGSKWIIRCAKRPDPRPLWILIWGGTEDLAQALHDDPTIKSKIRVYYIGGPNKKLSASSYDYLAREHPDLWIIEANETYRGWFVGGNQTSDLDNDAFVSTHVAGHGALGDFFAGLSFGGVARPTIKMGDTPSLVYLLGDKPEDPAHNNSWGGRFVRAWERARYTFDHAEKNPPTTATKVEAFSIVEIIYHPSTTAPAGTTATIAADKPAFPGFVDEAGAWHFIYSPKEPRTWNYTIKSTFSELDGRTGGFTSYAPTADLMARPSSRHPNWWTDDLDPAVAERNYSGVKTISVYREAFLRDFATRMERCRTPNTSATPASP